MSKTAVDCLSATFSERVLGGQPFSRKTLKLTGDDGQGHSVTFDSLVRRRKPSGAKLLPGVETHFAGKPKIDLTEE